MNGCAHTRERQDAALASVKAATQSYILCVRSTSSKTATQPGTATEIVLAAQGQCVGARGQLEQANIEYFSANLPDSYQFTALSRGQRHTEQLIDDTAREAIGDVLQARSRAIAENR